MMQQSQAQAAALAVAPSVSAVAPTMSHPNDPAGGDAPPKQVAQAMERLGRAGRLIADIRLGADRLLEALFVAGCAPPYSAPQHIDRTSRAVVQEEAAMRRHFQDLRALGRLLMILSLPHAVFRLALKAFTDQKRRFFPHLEDEVLGQIQDGEPGVTKKPRLSANGELEEASLSEILKNLGNEVPNMKIFTYRHLDWSKRASSLASLMDDDFVDPSKELNLQNMGNSRSSALTTSIDQVAVIEFLVPSIFRAIVSLHPAGSTDPDAVAFFSPTEGGSYLHARGMSMHHVFKHVKVSVHFLLLKTFIVLQRWIASYQTLFTKVCSKCGRRLMMDKSLALLLPPVHRPYHQTSNVGPDLQEAYHIGCSSYDI
ncbi:Mediator of RNA polymerase II transcription subunit 27 [Dichanthelium oligosanthes]|uniref:Mediator of RNA polymerase II transcription subunit 27 n=1 Tax=Dichanthelium oligosanthes TaxID=888268 RepID=A0A1E5WJF4_9POAL|nr:Mediator of RNA polymerase II transcription subunit 27 [Dichanthelium oligosanthes]